MKSKSHFSCGPQQDPCPQLLLELGPTGKGVGPWVPRDKHRLLAEYLHATRHAWKGWGHRVLIDPFCGPGRVQVESENFTRDGGAVVAWRESVASGVPFTKVLVGDKSPERAQACAARLATLGAPVESFEGPATETVPRMVARVPRVGALSMAYVDPYNLELLSFDLLQALAPLKVDIAAHFSTMDLTRNAEMEFDPARQRFESTAPGWRQDSEIRASSKQNLPLQFFRYWRELVLGLGFKHSKEMPLVHNNDNHPIYRLVFFARHELPLRVWGDVARGPNRELDF